MHRPPPPRARSPRGLGVVIGMMLLGVLAAGCSGPPEPSGSAAGTGSGEPTGTGAARGTGEYVGWVLGTVETTAIAFDITSDGNGGHAITAYVCDGMGLPSGVAAWFTGTSAPATPPATAAPLVLASAGATARLRIEALTPEAVDGVFVGSNGAEHRFRAEPASRGAGIYDIVLGQDLTYSGSSTRGSTLTATRSRTGEISGSIVTASSGGPFDVSLRSLPSAPPAELVARGLSPTYAQFASNDQEEGSYVTIVSGALWLGRGGDVRRGSPTGGVLALG